jgi:CRISPR-associated protein Cmr5
MNAIKTLEQERAKFCLEKVKKIKSNQDKSFQDKFKTAARNLPSFIVSNGLIPTLAFYKSKEEKKKVYEIINEWLEKRKIIENDALNYLVDKDFKTLRLATMEALALANWLKRIVEIELKEKE